MSFKHGDNCAYVLEVKPDNKKNIKPDKNSCASIENRAWDGNSNLHSQMHPTCSCGTLNVKLKAIVSLKSEGLVLKGNKKKCSQKIWCFCYLGHYSAIRFLTCSTPNPIGYTLQHRCLEEGFTEGCNLCYKTLQAILTSFSYRPTCQWLFPTTKEEIPASTRLKFFFHFISLLLHPSFPSRQIPPDLFRINVAPKWHTLIDELSQNESWAPDSYLYFMKRFSASSPQ